MVRVILSGGAGNQLFQFAAGRALSLKHETDLIVDLPTAKLFKPSNWRAYALSRFNAKVENTSFMSSAFRKLILKYRLGNSFDDNVFYEPVDFEFFNDFFGLPSNSTLYGYFQNEKYFLPYADVIRSELSFKDFVLRDETQNLKQRILKENSVFIHVRRGDAYLSNKKFNVCTPSYYYNAINLFRKTLLDPQFFIFSDDIQWCIDNFQGKDLCFCNLQQSKRDSLTDFYLMRLCKHSIIANSTFSWWSAWLNSNPDKYVAAPCKWLNISEDPANHIICDSWLKIPF